MDQPASAGKRVAFFGGSFDPPHQGHLAVARAAREALGLDAVLFAPVGAQPLKPLGPTAGFEDRVAMVRLAIDGEPGFEISLADAPRPGGAPNYTMDTLLGLRSQLAADATLFCLMGADSFFNMRHWHRAAEIPFVASLVVASRPGQPLDDLRAALPPGLAMKANGHSASQGSGYPSAGVRSFVLRDAAGNVSPFYLLPELHVEISASQVRSQIQHPEGDSAAGPRLVPAAVLDYIRARGLYR
jgi:nicotinate-nucleotide adenylyltransferase